MSQHYSNPKRAGDPQALPDIETFYVAHDRNDWVGVFAGSRPADDIGQSELEPGWYYWHCFPGCLPDSEPNGPYETEQEAIEAAQEDSDDE
jgi:hypothetical protein